MIDKSSLTPCSTTEELINALIEAGDLVGHPGHYRLITTLDRLVVPTNVRAVLAARIDRLPEAAKRLLQSAAVIGKEFSGPLLEAVTDLPSSEQASALERLKTGDFIFERALYPVFEYAFKHPLTHEVAYQSQLQSRRAVVHAAVARALEAQAGDKINEQAALLAHHCEAAGETLNAARWHKRAAEWAGMNDLNAAFHHWLCVRTLARQGGDEADASAHVVLACSQVLALAWRIGFSAIASDEIFEEGCATAERTGNLTALATLNAVYGAERGLNQAFAPDYERYTTVAVGIADQTGNPALRCGTRVYLAYAHAYCGHLSDVERIADEIIELAAEDPHLGAKVAGISPLISVLAIRLYVIGWLRDPAHALRELPFVREAAARAGYPEQALWTSAFEMELRYALGNTEGVYELAQLATRLAENLGATNELCAATSRSEALACAENWGSVSDLATDTLQRVRAHGAGRLWEPKVLALIGTAELKRGNSATSRVAAQEGVAFMRESQSAWNPHCYAVLAHAQLALTEPAADIAATLDEYEALLTRTGHHLYEGELHELRAKLAAREGHPAERTAALARAHACYTRFGMLTQAARIAGLQQA